MTDDPELERLRRQQATIDKVSTALFLVIIGSLFIGGIVGFIAAVFPASS